MTNQLAQSRSPYLNAAAAQPVHWLPWSDQAFERARSEDKPMLLDIGAAWCHWCHVMDHESYDDPEVAALLNREYVCVKVDRDERPDVDARYQRAVSALTGQGGWPLTAFLTPDGEVFFGGTYFPPDGRHGRPGFKSVLAQVASLYRTERDKVAKNAAAIRDHVTATLDEASPGELDPRVLDRVTDGMARVFDFRHGGFGGAPKFPQAAAVGLALARWHDTRAPWLLEMVTRTLRGMAAGGVYDQVGGGFHRYAVDERWIVPHFEKMASDNAQLLDTYLDAHAALGEPPFREVAEGIVRWVLEVLRDPTTGLFGGSQDADVGPDDDGDYFTWTATEARAVLDDDEWKLLERVFDIYQTGEMHHDPTRNVLYLSRQPVLDTERALVAKGRAKLKTARDRRPSPFVDRTPYVEWNAMMAAAFLKAAAVLDRPELAGTALEVAQAIWDDAWNGEGGMGHVIGEAEPRGILDDQVQSAALFLRAFERTGEGAWLDRSEQVMDRCWDRHWDAPASAGFFDRERGLAGAGFLTRPAKPLLDTSGPSGNGAAALVLARLADLSTDARWTERRDLTLRAFSGRLEDLHLHAASFARALDHAVNPVTHVVVVAAQGDSEAEAMHRLALRTYRPRKVVTRLLPEQAHGAALPSHLRAMVDAGRAPAAYLCEGTSCRPPVTTAQALRQLLEVDSPGSPSS